MLKVFFIGDVSGKIGREAVRILLPKIKKQHKVDIIIANADNVAHGKGVSRKTLEELISAGVDYFTNGDHAFDRVKSLDDVYGGDLPILRPANWPPLAPGRGYAIIEKGKFRVLLINLIGRVFMKKDFDCPFREIDRIFANPSLRVKKLSAIIIDMHAETTSEKVAMKYYVDGKASALIGTHTHIQTADEEITPAGTAYLTDAGMTGFREGSLGVEKEDILKTYLDQIKRSHVIPEKGDAILSGVIVAIDEKTGKAKTIKRIREFIEIK
ncbi:MAG: TIGR00282 family metallophosphoesterase [Patescibacteria group bacterium]|jgi:hypothetical protein